MKVTMVQMNSNEDKTRSMKLVEERLRQALDHEKTDMVILPELCTYIGGTPETARAAAEECPDGYAYTMFSSVAKEYGVFVYAGSMVEFDGENYHNCTLVFDPEGKEVARYSKIHLFDVTTPDGLVYNESDIYERGKEIVTFQVGDKKVGCAICYDLRFGELFVELAKREVDVIVLPAAFTLLTGKDHWEVLCRARAIETQTYFVAVNQHGTYVEDGALRANYGHSMVVDPWGTVIARASDKECFVSATLDFSFQDRVRADIPVQKNRVLGK